MKTYKTLFNILILISAAALLCSCGVRSSAPDRKFNADLSSQSIAADCNTFSASGIQLTGRIRTYTSSTGSVSDDVHQLVFSAIPTSFFENSAQSIRFFRWKSVGTTTEIDPEPLDFRMEIDNGFGSYMPVSGYTDYMNKDDLIKINSDYALGETEYAAVMRRLRFVIFGTDFTYQALQAVLYDGGSIVGKADMLLPVFDADPVNYALTHSDVLSNLHPLKNVTNLTPERISAGAQALCSGFQTN